MKHLSNTDQNQNKLTNIPTPVNDSDAVNKRIVDEMQTARWDRFTTLTTLSTNIGIAQGITFDGTFFYVTDSTTIYKYDLSGALLTSRVTTSDGTAGSLGDPVVVGGVLYVPASPSGTVDRVGYVREYATSNLAYSTEHLLSTTDGCSGVAHKDGKFYTVGRKNTLIREYNNTFTLLNEYETDHELPPGEHRWGQGITWVGDSVFVSNHGSAEPSGVFQMRFDGSQFKTVGILMRPTEGSTQGLEYSDGKVYFIDRLTNNIVFSKPDFHDTYKPKIASGILRTGGSDVTVDVPFRPEEIDFMFLPGETQATNADVVSLGWWTAPSFNVSFMSGSNTSVHRRQHSETYCLFYYSVSSGVVGIQGYVSNVTDSSFTVSFVGTSNTQDYAWKARAR